MKHANATSGFDELRPIFILGIMHRSGTNLLQDLLCLHPDCEPGGIIWEDGLIARAGPLIEYVNYLYKFWDSHWHIQEILGPSDLLYNCLGDGLLAFLHMQFAVRKNDKDLSSTSSSRRLVTKTPSVKNLQYFFKIFPKAHLLIIVRDGRAVVESGVKSFDWTYEQAMHKWAGAAETILNFTKDCQDQKYIIVRFEDLVGNQQKELNKIFSFLGLDPEKYDFQDALNLPVKGSSELRTKEGEEKIHWTPVAKTKDFNPLDRYKHWGRTRYERFNWIAGEFLERFGYTAVQEYSANSFIRRAYNRALDTKWNWRNVDQKILNGLRKIKKAVKQTLANRK